MNRIEVEREIVSLGGTVVKAPGTGEHVYAHPAMTTRLRVNMRRKSATKASTAWLRKLKRLLDIELEDVT